MKCALLVLVFGQVFSAPISSGIITRESYDVLEANVPMTLAKGVHWVKKGDFRDYHLNPTYKSPKTFCKDIVGYQRYKACFTIRDQGYSLGEEIPLVTSPGRCNGKKSKYYSHATMLHERSISAVGNDLGSDWSKLLTAKLPKNERDGQEVCMNFKTKGLGKYLWFRPILYKITAELISTRSDNGKSAKVLASAEAYTTLALPNGGVDGIFGQGPSKAYNYYTPLHK